MERITSDLTTHFKKNRRQNCNNFSFFIVLLSLFALIVSYFIPKSIADPDIWWHLRDAEYQLRTWSFLTHDHFSFTASNAQWMNHEWLAELPFYIGWHFAGVRGVYRVAVLAIELNMLGIFFLAYRKSRNIYSAFLCSLLAVILSTVSFGPRTLLFGWICLILELIILDFFREHEHVIWILPPLFLLWVNTHGSWIIGIVLLATFIVSGCPHIFKKSLRAKGWSRQQITSLCISFFLSCLCLFVNPYRWRLVFYPFNLAFRQSLNIANVEEWRVLDFHSLRGKTFLVSLAFVFLLQIIRNKHWNTYQLAFFYVGVYASFTYTRFLFLAAILCAPIMAKMIPSISLQQHQRPQRSLLNTIIAIVFILLLIVHVFRSNVTISGEKEFPGSAATAYVQSFHPVGNVFNEYLWGGYLIWNARQIPVFVDSRVDIFEYNGTFKDYLDAVRLKNTLSIFDKYHIEYVVFERDTPLVYFLEHTPGWEVRYSDATMIVLEKT